MSEAYALVRRALEQRRCVEAVFGGHRRRLCPHVLGIRDGEARALFFQFAGGSDSGLPPGGDWRCLAIDELSEVAIIDGPWRTRAHTGLQHCVEAVDLEVED